MFTKPRLLLRRSVQLAEKQWPRFGIHSLRYVPDVGTFPRPGAPRRQNHTLAMLNLPEVTLACIDTANHALALRALALSCAGIRFARVMFLTDAMPAGVRVPEGIDVVAIAPVTSRVAYSHFMLKELPPFISTEYVLFVQWDGYVINPDAWDPAFLTADYLGATWFWRDDSMRVGNGGFSLRSRRLLDALQDPRIELAEAEDTTICRTFRPLLEREHGIHFGSESLADKFAFEADYPVGQPFGFHGLFNFWRVVPSAELATLPALFSETIARSPQLDQLMRNCMRAGLWWPAIAIGRRIVATGAAGDDVPDMLADAEANVARLTDVKGDDSCPCGSGKRYEQCHGAVGAASLLEPELRYPTPDEYVVRGTQLHQRGELVGAGREYRAALVLAPEHPFALHNLGVTYYQRGRIVEAVELLERAVTFMPDDVEFQHSLGQALAAADRSDEAIALYESVLAQKPRHHVAWYNFGLALQAQHDLPQAIAAFQEALRLAPDFASAQTQLALALKLAGQ